MEPIPDPALVVLIGPSGSGKSTWAEQNFRSEEVISSDRLRASLARVSTIWMPAPTPSPSSIKWSQLGSSVVC